MKTARLPLLALTAALLAPVPPDAHAAASLRGTSRPVIVLGAARAVRRAQPARGPRVGWLDVNVKPKSTEVWVDGRFRGLAGSLDGRPAKLALKAGRHSVTLITPDGLVVRDVVRMKVGHEINLGLDLR